MGAQKVVVADLSLSLGLLTAKVDGLSSKLPEASKGSSFNMLCPGCTEPTKLSQGYTCESDHGPYTTGEITRRGKEVEGKLVEVSAAEIAAARDTGVETKVFAISVFAAGPVEATTLPGELSYRLRPHKAANSTERKAYNLFLQMAGDESKALIGEVNIKGTPKMARLTVFRGQLLIQTLIRPSDLAPADELELEDPSEKEAAMGRMLVDGVEEEFNPDTYTNVVRARMEALTAKAVDPDAPVVEIPTASKPEDDLLAVLEASIAAKKAA